MEPSFSASITSGAIGRHAAMPLPTFTSTSFGAPPATRNCPQTDSELSVVFPLQDRCEATTIRFADRSVCLSK